MPDGHDLLVVHGAVTQDFAPFLDPTIPFVWLLGHTPNPAGEWWQTDVPLNHQRFRANVQVRCLSYDLMINTTDFLRDIEQYNDSGLLLIQAQRPMPLSLFLDRIPADQQNRVLINNGATLKIYLPHAVETATIVSFRPGFLAPRGAP
jgi:hypothetical protein